MASILYSPEKEKPQPRKASITFNGVLLEPGFNTIDAKSLGLIKSHPDFPLYQSWGAIQVIEETLPLFDGLKRDDVLTESTIESKQASFSLDTSTSNTDEQAKPRRRRAANPKPNPEQQG